MARTDIGGPALFGVLALAGCAELGLAPAPEPNPEMAAPIAIAPVPRPEARTVEALDTTSEEQRAEAALKPAQGAETRLGTTVASLGDPTDPGFWIRTPLVNAPSKGRIEAANGRSAQVDLLPSGGAAGAGSQVSLPALRLLGVSLTDLPELTVFRF